MEILKHALNLLAIYSLFGLSMAQSVVYSRPSNILCIYSHDWPIQPLWFHHPDNTLWWIQIVKLFCVEFSLFLCSCHIQVTWCHLYNRDEKHFWTNSLPYNAPQSE